MRDLNKPKDIASAYKRTTKLTLLLAQRDAAAKMLSTYGLDKPSAKDTYVKDHQNSQRSEKAHTNAMKAFDALDKEIKATARKLKKSHQYTNAVDDNFNVDQKNLKTLHTDLQSQMSQAKLKLPKKLASDVDGRRAILQNVKNKHDDLTTSHVEFIAARDTLQQARNHFDTATAQYNQALQTYNAIPLRKRVLRSKQIADQRDNLTNSETAKNNSRVKVTDAAINVKSKAEKYKQYRTEYEALLKVVPSPEREILRAHNQAHKAKLAELSASYHTPENKKAGKTPTQHFQIEINESAASMATYFGSMNKARTDVVRVQTVDMSPSPNYSNLPADPKAESEYGKLALGTGTGSTILPVPAQNYIVKGYAAAGQQQNAGQATHYAEVGPPQGGNVNQERIRAGQSPVAAQNYAQFRADNPDAGFVVQSTQAGAAVAPIAPPSAANRTTNVAAGNVVQPQRIAKPQAASPGHASNQAGGQQQPVQSPQLAAGIAASAANSDYAALPAEAGMGAQNIENLFPALPTAAQAPVRTNQGGGLPPTTAPAKPSATQTGARGIATNAAAVVQAPGGGPQSSPPKRYGILPSEEKEFDKSVDPMTLPPPIALDARNTIEESGAAAQGGAGGGPLPPPPAPSAIGTILPPSSPPMATAIPGANQAIVGTGENLPPPPPSMSQQQPTPPSENLGPGVGSPPLLSSAVQDRANVRKPFPPPISIPPPHAAKAPGRGVGPQLQSTQPGQSPAEAADPMGVSRKEKTDEVFFHRNQKK